MAQELGSFPRDFAYAILVATFDVCTSLTPAAVHTFPYPSRPYWPF